MRTLITTIAAALILAPVAAMAAPPSDVQANASRDCAALRAKMGSQAFLATYSSFGGCVSKFAQLEQQNATSAQDLCTAEQNDLTFSATHNGKTFDQFYGTNPSGKNAFGNCVSLKTNNSSKVERSTLNPSQRCQALRTSMTAPTFALAFGTNQNHRNAFGKCVSKLAKLQGQNLLNSSEQCRTLQADSTFAATHSGQNFEQFYGTNADLSNAFGQCVSQKAQEKNTANEKALTNAARTCNAQLAADPKAFHQKYGTGPNAFGKCVSAQAKQ